MSDAPWIALIAMIGSVGIPAAVSCFTSLLAYFKSKQAFETAQNNAHAISELRITIDGRMDNLLQVTAAGSLAQGIVEGTASTRAAIADQARIHDDPAINSAVIAAREVMATAVITARELIVKAQDEAQKSRAIVPHESESQNHLAIALGENTRETNRNTLEMKSAKNQQEKTL